MPKARIAVIDDERSMREMLVLGLEREGYEVRVAHDATTLLRLVRQWSADALILDIMLPQATGIELLPKIRAYTQAPILMVTARGEKSMKLEALTLGADDYIQKPFDFDELLVRLEAALRRPVLRPSRNRSYAGLDLDSDLYECRYNGEPVDLTGREFDLLSVLLETPGKVVPRSTLLARVWGAQYDGSPHVLDTYVSYLRKRLELANAAAMVETVRGIGYRLQHRNPQ